MPASRPPRRPRPAVAALTAVVALTLTLGGPAWGDPSIDDLEQQRSEAERERGALSDRLDDQRSEVSDAEARLAEVGARLNDARGRLRHAEGQLALAEGALEEAEAARVAAVEELEAKEAELAATEQELARQEGILGDQAVATYKFGSVGARAGSAAFDVLRHADDPNELAVGMHQLGVVVSAQGITVETVGELRDEHAELVREADEARKEARRAEQDAADQVQHTDALREEAAALTAEVAEEERAQQAATRQLRSQAAETEESLQRVADRQARLEGEIADRRAAAEAERAAAAERERRARAAAASSSGSGGADAGSGSGSAASGSGGGPSHGGVCPVVGAVAGRDFTDDWGAPRSGGRTHQGNDIFASRGTPVVAIQDATVVRMNATESGLGGLTVTYRTADGSEWYNAHLDAIAPGIAPGVQVSQGQRVGAVGDSGNARGTPPHNHLGRRHGGEWVNPWPTISPLC